MQISVLAVGTRMPDWVNAGVKEYQRRMPRQIQFGIEEVSPGQRSARGAVAAAREQEATQLKKRSAGADLTIALDEQHARAYFNRGLLYRKDGNDFRAMRDFEAATDIDPAYARAYANRGYTMMIPIIPILFVLALG